MPVTGAPPPAALTHTLYFIRHGETDWNAEAGCRASATCRSTTSGASRPRRRRPAARALAPHYEDLDYVASPLLAHPRDHGAAAGGDRLHPVDLPRRRAAARALLRRLGGPDLEGGPQARSARRPRSRRDKWGFVPPEGRELRHARRARRAVPRRSAPATRSWSRMAASPARSSRSSATPRPTRRRGSTSGRGGCWCSRTRGTTGPEACGDRRHSRPVQRFGRHARSGSSRFGSG